MGKLVHLPRLGDHAAREVSVASIAHDLEVAAGMVEEAIAEAKVAKLGHVLKALVAASDAVSKAQAVVVEEAGQ